MADLQEAAQVHGDKGSDALEGMSPAATYYSEVCRQIGRPLISEGFAPRAGEVVAHIPQQALGAEVDQAVVA